MPLCLTIGLCICHNPHKPEALIKDVQSWCFWTSYYRDNIKPSDESQLWLHLMGVCEWFITQKLLLMLIANHWKFRSTAEVGYCFTIQKLKLSLWCHSFSSVKHLNALCVLSMHIGIHCSCPILSIMYVIVELFLASTRILFFSGFLFFVCYFQCWYRCYSIGEFEEISSVLWYTV